MAITQAYVDPAINANSGDGSIGNPWGDLQYALNTQGRDTTNGNQFNVKAGTAEALSAPLTLATYGTPTLAAPLMIRGYTSAANDGGMAEINCNGGPLWATTTEYSYISLINLTIHSGGDNALISVKDGGAGWTLRGCEIHRGASTPSGKRLVSAGYGSGNAAISCYIHDSGASGAGIGGFTIVRGNTIKDCVTGMVLPGNALAAGNVVHVPAAGVGIQANGVQTTIDGNTVCSTAANTGTGINASDSAGNANTICLNNIVSGFSGAGGAGIKATGPLRMVGHNAFYNCATNYAIGVVRVDLTAFDVALGADPFVSAATGDFSLTSTAKAALRGLGWPAAYLGAHANTDGHVTIGAIQYGEAEGGGSEAHTDAEVLDTASTPGTYHAPLAAEVISTAVFGVNSGTSGTVVQASVGDVQAGVTYGPSSGLTGTFAVPAVGDVQQSVGYGAGGTEFTGTFVVPAEEDVETGVQYGASGTEFTGTLAGGGAPDWTADEKKQIRQALGITGLTAATEATGDIKTQFAALADDTDIATAVRTELATELAYLTGPVALEATLTAIKGAGWTTQTLVAIISAIGSGGITAQQVRDALKLAPTAGAPAAGSIDQHLDDLDSMVGAGVPTLYAPTAATRVVGDNDGGTVASLAAHDDVTMSTGEVVGTGLEVVVTVGTTTLTEVPSLVRVTGNYNGSATHSVAVYLYNYTLAAWEAAATMLNRSTAFDYVIPAHADHADPTTGEMSLRFLHNAGTYNASHALHLDWVSFEKVETTSQLQSDIASSLAILQGLEANISDLQTDVSLLSSTAGSGSETVILECLDAASAPLEGVAVWVTTDSAGATVRAGTLYSNSLGRVTVFLDPGSYFVWRQGGANWSNPDPITVVDA